MKNFLLGFALLGLSWQAWGLCLLCDCVASTNSVAFGTYNPLSPSNITGVGDITVTCSAVLTLLQPNGEVSFSIRLSAGGSGTYSPRKMASGSNRLNYNLYTASNHLSVWGDGSGGTVLVNDALTVPFILGLLSSASKTRTVYGLIPGGQATVVPGTYTDTMTVTVTYN